MPKFFKYTSLHGRSRSPTRDHETVKFPITEPEQLPIFLIPGIFNFDHEMDTLANAIDSIYHGRRPIYIYSEDSENSLRPNADEADSVDQSTTIDESVMSENKDPIIAAIGAIMSDSPLPYLLIGYSNGGKKAVNAARSLQSMGYDARAFVIDATPEMAAVAYFNSGTPQSFKDLINIVNYAAQLSGMKNMIAHDQPELKALRYLAPQSLLEELANKLKILNANIEYSLSEFNKHIKEANLLLSPKTNEDNASTLQKVNNVTAFFTDDTLAKYTDAGIPDFKWKKEAPTVEFVSDPLLARCDHRAIIKDKDNATALANLIHRRFLDASIKREQLLVRMHEYYGKEIKRASSGSSNTSTHGSDSEYKRDSSSEGDSPRPSRGSNTRRSSAPIVVEEASSDGDTPLRKNGIFKSKGHAAKSNDKHRYHHSRRHS